MEGQLIYQFLNYLQSKTLTKVRLFFEKIMIISAFLKKNFKKFYFRNTLNKDIVSKQKR